MFLFLLNLMKREPYKNLLHSFFINSQQPFYTQSLRQVCSPTFLQLALIFLSSLQWHFICITPPLPASLLPVLFEAVTNLIVFGDSKMKWSSSTPTTAFYEDGIL